MIRAIRETGYRGPWIVEILSSYHLPDSLWKSDMDAMLDENRETFARLWEESEPQH